MKIASSSLVERLEPRRFLDAVLGGDGVLTVTGSEAGESIEFDRRSATQLKVEINDTNEQFFDYNSVSRIVVQALGGNDFVEFNDRNPITVPVVIFGGAGNDHLEGSPGNDTIFGDSGNDVLEGKQGADSIVGGSGRDRIEGDEGRDILKGGAHSDFIEGGDEKDTIYGGHGNDDLKGNRGTADRIFGEACNDDFDNSDRSTELRDRNADHSGANDNLAF